MSDQTPPTDSVDISVTGNVKGDVVGRDKIEGDKVLGDKVITNIDLGFKKAIKAVGTYFVSHIQVFVGVILAPIATFESLFDLQQVSRETFAEKVGVSIRPIIFAAVNIALGVIAASSLSIEGAPDSFGLPLFNTVTSQLFLWIIYSIFIHIFLVRTYKGNGTIGQTMSGVLYVLGTLQPFMLFFIYVVSTLFPGVLTYDLVTREVTSYDGTSYYQNEQLNFFGIGLTALYWLISFALTFSYLYFPLHLAHKLPLMKILFSYILGMILLSAFICISGISILILAASL